MRVLTTDEVRAAERESIARPGMSTLVLMQRAGTALAQFCVANFKFNSVCVVCGKGNNGGDGLVAAEALDRLAQVSVIILAKDIHGLSPDAAAICARLTQQPLWISEADGFEQEAVQRALSADLIIDAIFGTGYKPPLRGLAHTAVQAINNAFGTVVAVDLPTGVDADLTKPVHESGEETVFAHGIGTFIAPKPAHLFGDLTSGPIAVSEIGVQPVSGSNKTGLQVITGQEVAIAFPPRPRESNKGSFGHVLIIAGSLGKAGAAGIASQAALRTGAGLVTVACPKSIQATVAGFAPEVMTEGLSETAEGTISLAAMSKVEALLAGKDAIVLGPGISQNQETAEFARRVVAHCRLPMVLDADGLNAFAGRCPELKPLTEGFRVLTPHPGEAARLLGVTVKDIQSDRTIIAQRMAKETGSCVVLKGSRTIVAGRSGETWINMSGNPALAKGGTGDALSGMIGAALARKPERPAQGEHGPQPAKTGMQEGHLAYGVDPRHKQRRFQAEQLEMNAHTASTFLKDICVAAAVHLHGMAGDFARDRLHENTVLAGDILEHLSEAFRDCEQQAERELFYLQK